MAESKDFYTDALKAFDTPIVQPKQEAPVPAAAKTMDESAPQRKKKRRFSPWWVVMLCAFLCLVLVMGWDRDSGIRGENCAYGIVLEQAEDHIIFNTGYETWFVKLDGLEGYDPQRDIEHCHVWFFYNGKPREIFQKDCTREITATHMTIVNTSNYEDEIDFDLNLDGKKEHWSIRIAQKAQYDGTRALSIQGEDAKGNILYHVYMDVNYDFHAALSDEGRKLSLVKYCPPGIYENIDICLENGELAVYQGGEKQQLRKPSQKESYSVLFVISGKIGKRKQLSVTDGAALKQRLDDLDWGEPNNNGYGGAAIMNIFTADEKFTYSLGYEGVLEQDNKIAQIDTELYLSLLQLMEWQMPAKQKYTADLGDFEMVRIYFQEDGTASLCVWVSETGESKNYHGRYATLKSDYGPYYFLFLGEQFDQVIVLYQKADELRYHKSLSSHSMFPDQESIAFKPQ